jgi:hypothetical protein
MKVENKSPAVGWIGTSTLVDKWTDTEGNIWYKEFVRYQSNSVGTWYQLIKISNNGTNLEYMWSKRDFPVEADLTPDSATYRIYYLQ